MSVEHNWPLAPLPWQSGQWDQLLPLVEAGRLPHALLLAGQQGVGKQHFMQALAGSLLCHAPSAGTACGSCQSCALLQAGSHSDYLQLVPEEGSRVIKVDQVRALIQFANKTPSLGPRKVIVLGPAESMNMNAANAILKCLEEPSASTTLLLYSHQPSSLPATVRSRCQTLSLPLPAQSVAQEWLAAIVGSPEQARQLLDLADGRPLMAQQTYLADELESRLAIRKGLEAALSGQLSALQFPALVTDLELAEVLEFLQSALDRRLRQSLQAGDRSSQQAFLLRDELGRLKRSVSRGANPNRQLLLEDCVARMASVLGDNRS